MSLISTGSQKFPFLQRVSQNPSAEYVMGATTMKEDDETSFEFILYDHDHDPSPKNILQDIKNEWIL